MTEDALPLPRHLPSLRSRSPGCSSLISVASFVTLHPGYQQDCWVFLPSVSCTHSLPSHPTVTTRLCCFNSFLTSPCFQAFPTLNLAAASVFPKRFVNVTPHSETFPRYEAAIQTDVGEEQLVTWKGKNVRSMLFSEKKNREAGYKIHQMLIWWSMCGGIMDDFLFFSAHLEFSNFWDTHYSCNKIKQGRSSCKKKIIKWHSG